MNISLYIINRPVRRQIIRGKFAANKKYWRFKANLPFQEKLVRVKNNNFILIKIDFFHIFTKLT